MRKYLDLLRKNEIFRNFPEDMLLTILYSRFCHTKNYPSGKIIHEMGQPIRHMGIVLEGIVDIVHLSASGHDTIVSRLLPGGIFGESFSCAEVSNLSNEIRSVSDSVILFLDLHGFLRQSQIFPEYYGMLMENILRTLARSNVWLNTKMLILTQKTLRDKILTYFETLAVKHHSPEFLLPFNREQLASFLGSERSSLSRELCRMQEEGLLTIDRDYVRLHGARY